MDFKNNVKSILDCYLTEIKDEIKEEITDKITRLKCSDIIYHGVTDINDIKDWMILGYRVEELYKYALILKDKNISDFDLHDFNGSYLAGYERAHEEFKKTFDAVFYKTIREVSKHGRNV